MDTNSHRTEKLVFELSHATGCDPNDAYRAVNDTVGRWSENLWGVAVQMLDRNLDYPTLEVRSDWFRTLEGDETRMPTGLHGPKFGYDFEI